MSDTAKPVSPPSAPPDKGATAEREARLAAALRANLRRRKLGSKTPP